LSNRNLLKALCFACLAALLPARAETGLPREDPDPGRIAFLLAEAKTYLGLPYRYGGVSPKGFDCSGFVRFVFGSFGIDLSRSSGAQAKQGDPIALRDILPGDLLFFSTKGMRKGISHVGIYMGDGRFIHASSWGGPGMHCVRLGELASKYFADRLVSIRRVATPPEADPKTP